MGPVDYYYYLSTFASTTVANLKSLSFAVLIYYNSLVLSDALTWVDSCVGLTLSRNAGLYSFFFDLSY